MKAEELDRILHQKPFQPFRVVLKDGRSYEVRYRDLAALRGPTITIGTPTPGQEDPFADHLYNMDLADIIRVELLDRPAAAETK
ncbi:MAG TPA: hypothetical protein VJ739_07140 [Gemmataceae bacterium]|nr:hypothetical protein [Gemmataceae bacterium]